MAKLKQGILGAFSGRIGPIIGGIWKGIAYIKSAVKKGKKAPLKKTPRQIENQEKFKFMGIWLEPLHPFVSIGFYKPNIAQTEINMAHSYHYHNALMGVHPNLHIDYSKVMISKGKLPIVESVDVVWASASQLIITWDSTTIRGGRFDDQIMVMAYVQDIAKATGTVGGAQRRDGTYSLNLPPKFIGKPIELYLGISSLNRKKTANSIYLGHQEPPEDSTV